MTNMSKPTTTPTTTNGSNAPCPITKLPPELRQMIYDFYFAAIHLPSLPEPGTSSNLFDCIEDKPTMILKRFFNLLHYSSRVRAETAPTIYKACFTNVWFSCDVYERSNGLKRIKEMCSLIRGVNKDVEFGLRLVVNGCDEDPFSRFVDSVLGLQVEGEDGIRLRRVSSIEQFRPAEQSHSTGPFTPTGPFHPTAPFHPARRFRMVKRFYPTEHWGQQMLRMSKSGNCSTHWKSGSETHELWMSGKLGRLDWSQFDFEFPATEQQQSSACAPEVPL